MEHPSLSNLTTSKHVFIASMMHTSMRSPVLRDQPDVTCPSDFPDSDKRKEVVHHAQIPGYDVANSKRNSSDKKSNVVINAKSIPALRVRNETHLLLSNGEVLANGHFRARWFSC